MTEADMSWRGMVDCRESLTTGCDCKWNNTGSLLAGVSCSSQQLSFKHKQYHMRGRLLTVVSASPNAPTNVISKSEWMDVSNRLGDWLWPVFSSDARPVVT